VLEVLDGRRRPGPAERLHALLGGVPVGFHTHLLARDGDGRAAGAEAAAEREADRLAYQLLAPAAEVLAGVQAAGGRDPRRTAVIRELLAAHGGDFVEHHEGPLAPWLAGSRLVLAKSGTGSLEACLHGAPVVVAYQLRSVLATIGYHNILSVPFIAAANLIANRRVVPESCFHHQGGWDRVLEAARALWRDGPARSACIDGLCSVRRRLGEPGATARVAALVRAFLAEPRP